MGEWSATWPTEPGAFWFYGWKFGLAKLLKERGISGEPEPPKLFFVTVNRDGTGRPFYVTDGHFLYKAEGATGLWQAVTLPALPSVEELP